MQTELLFLSILITNNEFFFDWSFQIIFPN
jgi:hypothetical protein